MDRFCLGASHICRQGGGVVTEALTDSSDQEQSSYAVALIKTIINNYEIRIGDV